MKKLCEDCRLVVRCGLVAQSQPSLSFVFAIMPRWRQNGPDAAVIVKEHIAGRAELGQLQRFLAGRREWLDRYSEETIKRQYRNTIKRYKRWQNGGKSLLDIVSVRLFYF